MKKVLILLMNTGGLSNCLKGLMTGVHADLVTHGTYVNVEEKIFWSNSRSQSEGIKI